MSTVILPHASPAAAPQSAPSPSSHANADTGLALTVVMPASGRAHLVAETLQSLAAQTRRDWELIVPDDSPDEAQRAAINTHVEAFARETGIPTTYLFTAPRLLQSRNTNQGLVRARGRWVRILHSDDLVAPWGFEAELTIVNRFDPAIEALFVDPVAFRGTFEPRTDFRTALLSPRHLMRAMLHSGTALPSCTVFRRELLERIGPFDPGYDFLCDWKFFYRLLIDQIRRGRGIARVSPAWIGWRLHGDSVTGRMWATHYVEHLRLMEEIRASGDLTDVVALTEDEQADFFLRSLHYRHRRLFEDCRLRPDRAEPATQARVVQLLAAEPRLLEAQEEILKSPPPAPLGGQPATDDFTPAWAVTVDRALARQTERGSGPVAELEAGHRAAAEDNFTEAEASYRFAIELDPALADAWAGLGYALQRQGRHDDAVTALRRAVDQKPELVEPRCNLGHALTALKRHDDALAAYETAVAAGPSHAGALHALAYALLERGRAADALPLLRRADAAAPNSAAILADLARALAETGATAEGLALLAAAVAAAPAPARLDLRLAHARALVGCGRNPEATAVCDAILAIDPTNAEAAALRAEAQPFSGHYEAWRETRFAYILSRFGPDAFKGRSLLEMGAGHGILGSRFQELGAAVTCAEARADHVATGAARFPAQRFVCQNLEEDFRHLGIYDVVLHTGLLYHLAQPERHLRWLAEVTGEWLILETEVADSDDPEFILNIAEQSEAYDQSFVGVGTRPSAAYIERVLRSAGFTVERCDDPRINSGFHRYDWPVTNSDTWRFGSWEHGLRRFWLCRKTTGAAAANA